MNNYGMPSDMAMDMFGGSVISGKWINKHTGKEVVVRDSVIDGDSMAVMLASGQVISMDEFSRDYIQMSDEVYDNNGKQIGVEKITEPIKIEPSADYMHDDLDIPFEPKKHHHNHCGCDFDMNPKHKLVEKLFNKKNPNIAVNISIISDDFPTEELKMLIDVYDVSVNDIAEYIAKNYLNKEIIDRSISEVINEKLELNSSETPELEDNQILLEIPGVGNVVGTEDGEGNYEYEFVDSEGNTFKAIARKEDGNWIYFRWDNDNNIYMITYNEDGTYTEQQLPAA